MTVKTHIIEQAATDPKAHWLYLLLVSASSFYVEWINPIVIALTSIVGLVAVILLVRYHWLNGSKVKLDIELLQKEKERVAELEKQLSEMSDKGKVK